MQQHDRKIKSRLFDFAHRGRQNQINIPPLAPQVAVKPFEYWLKKNAYYHEQIISLYRFIIPEQSRVLQINGKNGYLLKALKVRQGVIVDEDIQATHEGSLRYPHYSFYATLAELPAQASFEYVILSLATMQADDIQELFIALQSVCSPRTRIVVDCYSALWEPVLEITQQVGLRRPTQFKNWVSQTDIENFLSISGYEVVSKESILLLPCYIPLLSRFFNSFIARLPFFNYFCLHNVLIARPYPSAAVSKASVSVIIPCRNEKGNIEAAVRRCPLMGSMTELIFVEGGSSDGTLEEVKRVAQAYPEKNISWYVQEGKGKGDAVRKGFAHARGDILMILDADLTVPPEELPKFFELLVSGKGEFINGSRLVYGMEQGAMRFLNLLANRFFSTLFSWLLGQKVKDTLCGTKVLWAHDYATIAAHRAYFGTMDPFGDFDLLFGAAKLRLKIVDMPVHYKSRVYGSTQIRRFMHGWILLGMSLLALKKLKFR